MVIRRSALFPQLYLRDNIMKIPKAVALATIIIAVTNTATVAAAPEKSGHYEWRSASRPGPNKSNLPNLRRVWVADAGPVLASKGQNCEGRSCCQHGHAA
jgi:hypothetical protein